MMGTQPLPPHQQPGGGGPLGLKKQQEFLGNMSSSIYQIVFTYVFQHKRTFIRVMREENLNEYFFKSQPLKPMLPSTQLPLKISVMLLMEKR